MLDHALPEVACIPVALHKSLQGRYFVGYADFLDFGAGTSAWARLYNPLGSGVNLHVNVFTITGVLGPPYRIQIWFNATPPGTGEISDLVSPANTALTPLPTPLVQLQLARRVTGAPVGGTKAFVRRGLPETTIVSEEDGKFIFPPGGSFLVFLSDPESPEVEASGRVAFGWWEEPIPSDY